MSSLQWVLMTLGFVVVAGVFVQGWLTAKRAVPRYPSAAGHPDSQEPTFSGGHGDQVSPAVPSDAVVDSFLASGVGHATDARKGGLDPLIDAVVVIQLENPLSADAVIPHIPVTRRVGSKPLAMEGVPLDGSDWESLQPGRFYTQLQAGVQLANRHGALNEIEFSEFVMKVQTLSDAIGGSVEFPDMLEVVARARELDQFAAAHDAQLQVNLHAAHVAWSPGYVQQCASRVGMVPGAVPGKLVLLGTTATDAVVLTLSFDAHAALADDPMQSALSTVTVELDVPQVPESEAPFVCLRTVTRDLMHMMDAKLTDDRGQVLTDGALDQIAVELARLYSALSQRDVTAGSTLAKRLFS